MRRLVRLSRLLVLTFVLLGVTYLVAINGALVVLKRVANRHPDRIFVDYRATTLVPGVFDVRDFTLRMQDRYTQWELRIDRARVRANLTALVRRTFDVRSVSADGVRFRIRRKRMPSELDPRLAQLQPPIPGFGPAVRDDARFQLQPLPKHAWTVRMHNVKAVASEIWVDAHRFEGRAQATGAWRLRLGHEAEIMPADVQLSDGRLLSGEAVVANALNGDIDLSIGRIPARRPTAAEVLESTNVTTRIEGALSNDRQWLNQLGLASPLLPRWHAATFEVDATLRRGVPMVGSRIEAELSGVRAPLGGWRARTNAQVRLTTAAEGRHALEVTGRALEVRMPDGGGVIGSGGQVRLTAQARGERIDRLELPTHAKVQLRAVRLPDARVLNELIPDPTGLLIRHGRARVDGRFSVNLAERRASGEVRLAAPDLALAHRNQQLSGNLEATVRVNGLRPTARSMVISGSRIAVNNVRQASAPKARPWAGSVEVAKGRIDLDRREIFTGSVRSNLHDARPLFALLLDGTKTPRWSRKLLTPNHVGATADVGFGRRWVRLDAVNAKVGRTQVRAIVRLDHREVDLAGEVSLGRLRAGVYQQEGRRRVRAFPRRTWFPEHRGRVEREAVASPGPA